ncbi:MAG: penicillin-binding protein 2 [Solirubrobacterales bacterium]|nr:penicillin-binding protein 2 [Solirubrobacterales bacterium]
MSQLPEDKQLRFVKQEERPTMSPQLARRVAIVGTLSLALFAILFFRLWFLQVLSSDHYARAASVNFVRPVEIAAPRGQILDRSGTLLASSQRAYAVEISPPQLPVPVTEKNLAHPPRADAGLYNRLANVVGLPTKRQLCHVNGHGMIHVSQIACAVAQEYVQLPYAEATVATDITQQQLWYLSERQASLPGVSVQQIYQRTYPRGDLAAQVLGIVSRITASEVKDPFYRGASANDVVGQSGLEGSYDRYLRGIDGANKVQVDALGNFVSVLSQTPPVPGSNLKLSLDAKLEQVGQQALQQSIDANYPANGGAFVAMNPENGQIYAMGSLPTYNANLFTRPVPQSVYDTHFGPTSGDPLVNRADQGAGPTGSTFKPLTATAALESGVWTTSSIFDDTGQFCISGQCRHNAGNAVDGSLDLLNAIKVSSDDFFYNLGALTNSPAPNGGALQHWAHLYGIGRKTGIDLPGENPGTLPDAKWRDHRNQLEAQCDSATGSFSYTDGVNTSSVKHPGWHRSPKRAPGGCGIADGTNRPWSIGDNESLAVGQGDVQVTPLQLAVAYATIANGGAVVTPHLGLDVQSADGIVLRALNPHPARHLNIDPLYLETIRAGLRAAASQPGGTSAEVFQNFPEQVYGKTGTAQYNGQQDYAWYACFVPASATSKPILVVVTVQQGGFGAIGAAPVARQMLSQWFFGNKGAYVAGNSRTL